MIATQVQWAEFIRQYPDAHILQTGDWGLLKSDFGWNAERITNGKSGALVLFRKILSGFTMAYIPKGPIGNNWEEIIPELDNVCHIKDAFMVKIEFDAFEERIISNYASLGTPSRTIQPRRSIIVDLTGDEDSWLKRMKQKTRYNIRLAEKKGVTVREASDTKEFNRLMRITSERDAFDTHQPKYYERVFNIFHAHGDCVLFEAVQDQQVLAAIMVLKRGTRAWYFYGASSDEHRNLMPTFLLQYQAMRWAASSGCTEYDLWGIPDADEITLEQEFMKRSDGLWGVYRFKRGFGGRIVRSAPAIDRIYSKTKYALYSFLELRKGNSGR